MVNSVIIAHETLHYAIQIKVKYMYTEKFYREIFTWLTKSEDLTNNPWIWHRKTGFQNNSARAPLSLSLIFQLIISKLYLWIKITE